MWSSHDSNIRKNNRSNNTGSVGDVVRDSHTVCS